MSSNRITERFTLQANERLKLRKQIETLFQKGEAFSVFPVRIVYSLMPYEGDTKSYSPVRIGFSIPKKRLKHAVDRNRIKRLLREAWRTQKHTIYPLVPADKQLHCFIIYTNSDAKWLYTQAVATISKVNTKLAAIISASH